MSARLGFFFVSGYGEKYILCIHVLCLSGVWASQTIYLFIYFFLSFFLSSFLLLLSLPRRRSSLLLFITYLLHVLHVLHISPILPCTRAYFLFLLHHDLHAISFLLLLLLLLFFLPLTTSWPLHIPSLGHPRENETKKRNRENQTKPNRESEPQLL